MRVSAPVTDYIRASVINTRGDLFTRGDLVPERLSAGLVNTFFRGKGAGVIPAYENLGEGRDTYLKAQGAGVPPIFEKLSLRDTGVNFGSFTRSTAGDQIVKGIGYRSTMIIFLTANYVLGPFSLCIGFDNGVTHMCISGLDDLISQAFYTDRSIDMMKDGANCLKGFVSTIGGDGFTATFTILGSTTLFCIYLCFP